jgi:hypothetical protein
MQIKLIKCKLTVFTFVIFHMHRAKKKIRNVSFLLFAVHYK